MKFNGNFVCPSCGKGIHIDAKYDSDKPTLELDIEAVGPEGSNELELEEMEKRISEQGETEITEEEELEEVEEEMEEGEGEEPEEDVHY